MKTWILVTIIATFALGFVTILVIADHAEQQAVIRTQTATSAATSITLFLVLVILGIALLAAVVVGLSCWLRQCQEREKMHKIFHQAQIYALLSGARSPRAGAGRVGVPGLDQASGNIIVFPGSGQQPTPQLTAGDLRAMMSGQPDILTKLLPPDGGTW